MSVRSAIDEFIDHTLKAYPDLETIFDPDWRSPCEIGDPYRRGEEELIRWRPTPRNPATATDDFAPLERALEITVHPDIKEYYAAYWAAGLEAEAVDGHVSLLFLWNADDVARLNENLIGHSMAKQRAKSAMSVFFACTEPDSELFLSVDNESGAVLLEKPGYAPIREVAPNLEAFLTTLVPSPPVLHP
jgi:SecY interacting protein Syd